MKSLQVLAHIPEADQYQYSDLCVMKSAAGWYVGTIHSDPSGFQQPGSRDTDYFQSEGEAKFVLEVIERVYKRQQQLNLPIMASADIIKSILVVTGLDHRNVGYRMSP